MPIELLDAMMTNMKIASCSRFFFLKGLPISTNNRKRSIPPCKYQACQTDMEVDTNPILQASPPPPRYRCKCIETHRMCSRVAVGALPMPCKCIATGSKCFQSGRTTCQHGPGQALCSRLPCLVQCRTGPACCLLSLEGQQIK